MDWSGCESSLEPPFPRQEYVRARLTLTPSCLFPQEALMLFLSVSVPHRSISKDLESRIHFHNWLRLGMQLCPRTIQKNSQMSRVTQTLGCKKS